MKVREIMTWGIESVQSSNSVHFAAEQMKRLDIGSLAVFEGNRLVGMITDRDIVIRVVSEELDPATTQVRKVMSLQPKICREESEVTEAVKIMEDNHVRRLFVESNAGKITGIVTLDDIALPGEEKLVTEAIREVHHAGPVR
ncbi:MAG: CBS domain-containing protein [Chitinispirillaceae bacterium]|jgi:CBS domain-containing protein|nr:CBS domain-containing protein [Chitinispirillaceae bacterium]